jgi:hypothetical protein
VLLLRAASLSLAALPHDIEARRRLTTSTPGVQVGKRSSACGLHMPIQASSSPGGGEEASGMDAEAEVVVKSGSPFKAGNGRKRGATTESKAAKKKKVMSYTYLPASQVNAAARPELSSCVWPGKFCIGAVVSHDPSQNHVAVYGVCAYAC